MRRFYSAWGVIFLTASGVALTLFDDFTVLVGVWAGMLIGIAPFVGWHLILLMTRGFTRKDRILPAVGIAVGKFALIGLALWAARRWIDGWALIGGMSTVMPALAVLAIWPPDMKVDSKNGEGAAGSRS